MPRKSARLLGRELGISSSEVYRRLEQMGLIEKVIYSFHGTVACGWQLTSKGKAYGEMSMNYPIPVFDEDILDLIKDL